MNGKTTLFTLAVAGYSSGIQIGQMSPAGFLAQIRQAEDISHTCSTAHRRATNSSSAVLDFNSNLTGSSKYTDSTFPYRDALWWADMDGETENDLTWSEIDWVRASEKFPDRTLWGATINPNDIGQGDIGNCWVMAALSGFAEYEQRVENVFVNEQKSANGIYALRLYALGVPHTVVIDDYLALMDNADHTIYARLS